MGGLHPLNLPVAAEARLTAGDPHYTGLSQALERAHLVDFAKIVGIELVTIDEETTAAGFRHELCWNQAYQGIAGGA